MMDNLNNNNNITKDYYLKSINLILKKFKKVKFYIFSDDIIWCKENFKNMKNESFKATLLTTESETSPSFHWSPDTSEIMER